MGSADGSISLLDSRTCVRCAGACIGCAALCCAVPCCAVLGRVWGVPRWGGQSRAVRALPGRRPPARCLRCPRGRCLSLPRRPRPSSALWITCTCTHPIPYTPPALQPQRVPPRGQPAGAPWRLPGPGCPGGARGHRWLRQPHGPPHARHLRKGGEAGWTRPACAAAACKAGHPERRPHCCRRQAGRCAALAGKGPAWVGPLARPWCLMLPPHPALPSSLRLPARCLTCA